jgi:hypothetical protein
MRIVDFKTNQGKYSVKVPSSWNEVTVEQFQNWMREWDKQDYLQAFGLITNTKVDAIAESKSSRLEASIYQTIAFMFDPNWNWNDLKLGKELRLQPMWMDAEDRNCWMPITVKIPRRVGRFTIGQSIQARKSLEGVKDLREGMSIVTAIYLQPLIDNGKFDMLRVIEIERIILKMKITDIYPIGFFLLRRLTSSGNLFSKALNLLKQILTKRD